MLIILVGKSRYIQSLESLHCYALRMLRLLTRQCEFHAGHNLRNALQLHSLYSRIWGEESLRLIVKNMRQRILAHGRHVLLSATCLATFDWERDKIPDSEVNCSDDLDNISALEKATIFCEKCDKRELFDCRVANVDYCSCPIRSQRSRKSCFYDNWEPFIEREHIVVWRRPHDGLSHLYDFKVHGTYDDISLAAFVEVQMNTDLRKSWDKSALDLHVIDSHPDSGSDLVYWLVQFPFSKFFANRDYVYQRRLAVTKDMHQVVIVNQSLPDGGLPPIVGVHRVKEYWSVMVIREVKEHGKTGIEYTLTYFDNPGTCLPNAITAYIAKQGFPDYLVHLHDAALQLQLAYENGQDVYVSLPPHLRNADKVQEEVIVTKRRSTGKISPQQEGLQLPSLEILVPDTCVQVHHHGKQIVVDLLEALEVVAPDLPRRNKEGKGHETSDDPNGQKYKRLGWLSVEQSPDERDSRYQLCGIDDGALHYLTVFFMSMHNVLEADKNIKIGRGLWRKEKCRNQAEIEMSIGGKFVSKQRMEKSDIKMNHSMEEEILGMNCEVSDECQNFDALSASVSKTYWSWFRIPYLSAFWPETHNVNVQTNDVAGNSTSVAALSGQNDSSASVMSKKTGQLKYGGQHYDKDVHQTLVDVANCDPSNGNNGTSWYLYPFVSVYNSGYWVCGWFWKEDTPS